MGIVERHRDILERLKVAHKANEDLGAALSITPNLNEITKQADAVSDHMNRALKLAGTDVEMTWDGVILGVLHFSGAILRAAREQLEEALGTVDDDEGETVH